MSKIFISHVHEEGAVSMALTEYLRACQLASFLSSDSWQIMAGERWFDRIVKELDDAATVILMLTPKSVNRPWISFEAGWAWAKATPTIPVCFGGLDKGSLPRPYSDIQAVNLRTDHFKLAKDCMEYMAVRDHSPITFLPPPNLDERNLISALDKFESSGPSGKQ
jgi:hypothetical protein